MKLDATVMRTMNRQDFRVLGAVETGMKHHALVPASLIASIANLRHGGTGKILSSLLRDKLLNHDQSCGYDGYRLTNSGYDILALYNLKQRNIVAALGDRIGTGKESDVYVAITPKGKQIVLKFHRLGRTSFRDVKKKRDYFMVNAAAVSSKNKKKNGGVIYHNKQQQQPNSWLFLSRISALKEYTFMKALHQVDYPTPIPIGHNRHVVVMNLIRGMPLYQIHSNRISAEQAENIFQQSTALATRLAKHGLVHCDLNEFNLMVDLSGIQNAIITVAGNNEEQDDVAEHYVRHSGMSVTTKGALSAHGPLQKHHMDGTGEIVTEQTPEPMEFLENGEAKPIVTLIDFPQMVSTRHPNAQELYERDLQCLKRFFVMKLRCLPETGEEGWDEVIPKWEDIVLDNNNNSDTAAAAAVDDDDHQAAHNDDYSSAASTCCIASRAQLRLDEELKASGFSTDDSNRDMELYYFERNELYGINTVPNNDENAAEDDDSGDEAEQQEQPDENDDESLSDNERHVEQKEGQHDEEKGGTVHYVFHSEDTAGGDEKTELFYQRRRAAAEEKAKARVRQHLEERKKKGGKKNAFRSRNSNKTYVKGKRVMNDLGY